MVKLFSWPRCPLTDGLMAPAPNFDCEAALLARFLRGRARREQRELRKAAPVQR